MKIDENLKPLSSSTTAKPLEQDAEKTVNAPTTVKSKRQQQASGPASKVTLESGNHCQAKLAAIAQRYGLTQEKQGKTDKPTSVSQRAERRERLNRARKQQNLENIMDYAMDYVDTSTVADDVDPDWLYQFFEMSESIFSEQMQALWGKILAMQVSHPGSFSLKALKTLNQMTVKEAVAFQHACALIGREKKEHVGRIVSGYFKPASLFGLFGVPKVNSINLSKFGLSYPNLLTLIDLNIIYASEIETGALEFGYRLSMEANGQKVVLTNRQQGAALQYYKLTQTGNELAKLIKVNANQAYFQHIANAFSPVFELTIAS